MSTITREFTKKQLIEKLQHRIAVAAKYPDLEEAQLDAAIFKIALASLEAEPVAFINGAREPVLYGAHIGIEIGTNLYTAPPAPLSLPDESAVELLATDLMKRIDKITGERHSVATLSSLRISIVEACRAAMLQGADGNSPVIQDGWVACSERMPKFGDCLVTDGQDFDVQMFNGEQFIPGFVWEDNITHWMPLPAAPQQEVK